MLCLSDTTVPVIRLEAPGGMITNAQSILIIIDFGEEVLNFDPQRATSFESDIGGLVEVVARDPDTGLYEAVVTNLVGDGSFSFAVLSTEAAPITDLVGHVAASQSILIVRGHHASTHQ